MAGVPATAQAANRLRVLENVEAFFGALFRVWRECLASCMSCTTCVEERFGEAIHHQKCLALQEQRQQAMYGVPQMAPGLSRPAAVQMCNVHGPY
eukprot:Gregarina_sp_Pseudo_9__1425@NODE_1953_length_1235_cov_42_066054_g1810_i0_p5_GENE_NODE_1953_length_1235_cov_42_066054_g1810_i0NODE_1953_length_1235_cov_42_066054_g1810_i0_p5_ORF_typecomplete_len109_score23_40_NODE_1953_length_1235_cov_42_066054_g1810_i043327